MAIPPELELRNYASKHDLTIEIFSRTDTVCVVTFKKQDDLSEKLEEMITHYSKRQGITVDAHLHSIVFLRQEAPSEQVEDCKAFEDARTGD